MIPRDIDKITEADLQNLILNSVAESKSIEYKSALPANSDSDKKEFLADVSSFANAAGGDLILGIQSESNTGLPKSVDGISTQNSDQEISRLDNMIRDGIEPRLPTFIVRNIRLSNGNTVFIIRIPKSWVSPHRVSFKNHDRFYCRRSNGKYPMDVSELRIAFNLSETAIERIRKFRESRISKVIADETPVALQTAPRLILHLISYASFSPAHTFDVAKVTSWPTKLRPLYSSGWDHRFNLDGLLTFAPDNKGKVHSYVQAFKNGIIEAVETAMLDFTQGIPSVLYERELIRSLTSYLQFSKELGVELPAYVFLTFVGVRGRVLAIDPHRFWNMDVHSIDRDILDLSEVQVDSFDQEAQHILRPQFDSVWNSCGYERCFNYDNNGNWVGH